MSDDRDEIGDEGPERTVIDEMCDMGGGNDGRSDWSNGE
jgi:hypothetical protein